MGRTLEIVKRYTWDEVAEAYPGKWVYMKNCTFEWGNEIVDGVFAGAFDDSNVLQLRLSVQRERNDKTKNDRVARTEIGMGLGFIDCLNDKMEVRADHKFNDYVTCSAAGNKIHMNQVR